MSSAGRAAAQYWRISDAPKPRPTRSAIRASDTSQNWAAEAGFRLAHELLETSVESDLQRSVHDLHAIGDTFDIILCLGIYYHLIDPFLHSRRSATAAMGKRLVIIEGDAFLGPDGFLGLTEESARSGAPYSGDLRKAPASS
jgi:tRNA (mo5U34)-methyltransferase